MWAPGNTAGSPDPLQPGRTCDSPSGCRPHTGAPLHHPVKTIQTSVFASVHAWVQIQLSVCVLPWEDPRFAHTSITWDTIIIPPRSCCVTPTFLMRYFKIRDRNCNHSCRITQENEKNEFFYVLNKLVLTSDTESPINTFIYHSVLTQQHIIVSSQVQHKDFLCTANWGIFPY